MNNMASVYLHGGAYESAKEIHHLWSLISYVSAMLHVDDNCMVVYSSYHVIFVTVNVVLGLPSHPQHELAKTQCTGFGGMVSFRVKGDKNRAQTFLMNLKVRVLTDGTTCTWCCIAFCTYLHVQPKALMYGLY